MPVCYRARHKQRGFSFRFYSARLLTQESLDSLECRLCIRVAQSELLAREKNGEEDEEGQATRKGQGARREQVGSEKVSHILFCWPHADCWAAKECSLSLSRCSISCCLWLLYCRSCVCVSEWPERVRWSLLLLESVVDMGKRSSAGMPTTGANRQTNLSPLFKALSAPIHSLAQKLKILVFFVDSSALLYWTRCWTNERRATESTR